MTTATRIHDHLGTEVRDGIPVEFVEALVGPLQDIDDVVRDNGPETGWSVMLDLDRIPADNLAWLAQFIGAEIIPGLSDAEQRDRIRDAEGFRRGTRGAMENAAKSTLTGTKKVNIFERDGGAYLLTVQTYATQTPDAVRTEAAIRSQKPGGLVLTYVLVTGATYAELDTEYGTYADMDAAFADYAAQTSWTP